MDLHYKIHADSDQAAKFQGDRSRELGERVAKKRKTSRAFYKSSRTTVTGGLITKAMRGYEIDCDRPDRTKARINEVRRTTNLVLLLDVT